MKILITGSNGFLGRNLVAHHAGKAHELLTPSRLECDLSDYKGVYAYLAKNKPDMVIHGAGKVGGIQANMREMSSFMVVNFDIGRNLIGACAELGIKKLMNIGSSCCYPPLAAQPFSEDLLDNVRGPLEPTNEGYAIAKVAMVRYCEFLAKENPDFHYKSMIPCNLYGKYDKFDDAWSHMIPGVIKKIHHAKKTNAPSLTIWGDGTARREFMVADDCAEAIWFGVNNFDKLPNITNIGLNQDWSINEYYRFIRQIIGWDGEIIHDLTKPVGMKQKLLNSKKLYDMGFKPQYSLLQGLQKTYEYFLTLKEFNQ